MKARMEVRQDPDAFDLEQLRETIASPGYQIVQRRHAEMFARELAKLQTVETWDNARYVQGFIAGVQAAAEVPRILESEIRARLKRKKESE